MINFPNVNSCNINCSNEFLGGDIVNYRRLKQFNINGFLLGTGSSGSFVNIWTQTNDCYGRYFPIYLDNYLVATGKVTNITFDAGVDVTSKPYSASFEYFESVNIDFTGIYSGLPTTHLHRVRDFQESFSLEKTADENVQFERSFSFTYDKTDENAATLRNRIGSVASGFFSNSPEYSYFNTVYPSFYLLSGARNFSEVHDTINCSYNFSERFSSLYETGYNWTYRNQFTLENNGIINVVEDGEIIGVRNPSYNNSITGYNVIANSINTRVSGFYNYYINNIYTGISCTGIYLRSKSRTDDPCLAKIGYSFEYTNDENYKNTGIYWEYSNSYEKDLYYQVSEQGTVKSLQVNVANKIDPVLTFFNTNSGQIYSRIYSMFTGIQEVCDKGNINLTNRSRTFSAYNGTIDYDFNYSNDPKFKSDGTGVYVNIQNNINEAVPLTNKFDIINFREIAQPTKHGTLGSYSQTIDLVGHSGVPYSSLLQYATGFIQKPTSYSTVYWMTNMEVEYFPCINKLTLDAAFSFVKNKEPNSVTL